MDAPGDFGLMQPAVWVHADGPRLKAYLTIFAAKFAMALYREHVGVALGLDGCRQPSSRENPE